MIPAATDPAVTIVIVSFNTRDLLERCIDSIAAHGSRARWEIVVVDNASADGTREMLEARSHPPATTLFLPRNVGFAAACNIGVDAGHGRYVLLVNPDTEMRAGCIDALLDCAERNPNAGVIGGRTVSTDGTVDPHSCWALPSLWSMFCFATGLSTIFPQSSVFDPESLGRWPRDTEREVGVVTGCLLLCERSLWDELGGMDETYFVYGEDVDFSWRARRAGWRPRITPDAELVHIRGAASSSSASKWALILRGKVTFILKRWPGRQAMLPLTLLLIGTALRAAAARGRLPVAGPWQENWRTRHEWLRGWSIEPSSTRTSTPH